MILQYICLLLLWGKNYWLYFLILSKVRLRFIISADSPMSMWIFLSTWIRPYLWAHLGECISSASCAYGNSVYYNSTLDMPVSRKSKTGKCTLREGSFEINILFVTLRLYLWYVGKFILIFPPHWKMVEACYFFVNISFERWAIWFCIYCKKVRGVQRPIFIMVVSP